jgi:predicted MFS family arabinose efflux permease
MSLLRVYLAFAGAYLLSYLLRMVNAVISPELTEELELSASSLGLLTAAYPLAFMAMQLPLGLLIDRYGPRVVETALLMVAALGALLFGLSESTIGLVASRALIGAGVSACLMASLNAFHRWYPVEKRPAMTSWMMTAGGLGAVFATTPVEWGLTLVGWRALFVVLAGLTLVAAAGIWFSVPDAPRGPRSETLRGQLAGVGRVMSSGRFWRIAPIMAVMQGTFMALQGLWSVPWMMEVEGMSRGAAAVVLLGVGVVMLCASLTLSMVTERLGRAGISHGLLFAVGMAWAVTCFGVIAWRGPGAQLLLWGGYAAGIAVSSFAFNLLAQGVPLSLAGRATTALNLFIFLGSVIAQWGVGMASDAWTAGGASSAEALQKVFKVLLLAHVGTYLWFVAGWRELQAGQAPEPVR